MSLVNTSYGHCVAIITVALKETKYIICVF